MNKLSKILALVLLLAVVLSVFAGFSIFAEEAAALTPNTTLDLDTVSVSSIDVVNKLTITHDNNTPDDPSDDYSGPGLTMTKETDDDGEVYWLLQSHALAGQSHGSGAYLNYAGTGVNPSYSFGNAKTSSKQAVDFFVIDMDVSTDTEFFTNFYLHSRFTGTAGNVQDRTCYPGIYGDDADNMYVDSYTSSNKSLPTVDSNDEWRDITFVYDFRGNDYSAWKMYAYIDGYFVGAFAATSSTSANTAYQSYFIRPSISDTAATDFESMKIRNWTYTNFPVGWQGDLTAVGTRGAYAVPLSEIDELTYCLEGDNAEKAPIASVLHQDGTTEVRNTFEDLNASFLAGDVVTLNRNVGTPILVNASDVTFVDNGYSYKLVDTTDVDFSTAAFVVQSRINRSVIASGDAEAFATYFASNGLTNGYMVTLFEDLTWAKVNTSAHSRQFIFELNGHKITLAAADRFFDTNSGSEGVLRYQNGSFSYAGTGADLTMLNNNNAIIFENVKFSIDVANVFIDQRHGLIRFKDCDVDVNYNTEIASTKSSGKRWAAVEIIDSSVTKESGADAMLICSNYGTSSKRQGGANIRVDVSGSEINWPQNIIQFEAYANGESLVIADDGTVSCSDSVYGANAFDLDFDFTDSTVNSTQGYYLLRFTLYSLKSTAKIVEENDFNGNGKTGETITVPAENAYFANGLSIDLDINIDNSTVRTYDLVRMENTSGYTSATVPHTFDMDIVADGESFVGADAGLVFYNLSKADEAYTCDVVLGEGTKLNSPLIDRNGNKQKVTSTTLGDGTAKIVRTSLYDDFGYIVTSDYDTYTYQLGNKAPVEFFWNGAEGEKADPAAFVKLADSDLYTYTWAQDGNAFTTVLAKDFTVNAKSNLTLVEDFQFNLYIPADQYTKYAEYITVTDKLGNVLTGEEITIDGVDYVKFKAKNVAPSEAEDGAMTVAIAIDGAYGDKYEASSELTVLDYTEKVIAGGKAEEIAFIDAILNYISAAYAYAGKDAANVNALISEDAEFATEIEGDAKLESAEGIEVALNYGTELNWAIKATAAATVTVEYTYDGGAATKTVELAEGESFMLAFKAYDMINSIKVNGAEVNLKGYYNALTNDNAKAMVLAIYNYVKAAAEYKAA